MSQRKSRLADQRRSRQTCCERRLNRRLRVLLQVSKALRDRKDQASGSTRNSRFAKRYLKYLPKRNLLDPKHAESILLRPRALMSLYLPLSPSTSSTEYIAAAPEQPIDRP